MEVQYDYLQTSAEVDTIALSTPKADPTTPDWEKITLPDTWPDALNLGTLKDLAYFLKCIVGKRKPIEIPDDLMGKSCIPKYVQQEFHNLPNGNYSNSLTHGYITGFEYSMLNKVAPVREFIAHELKDCKSVLDLGTAGGKTAAAVKRKGVEDVWGLDPSPYLLQYAARAFKDISFVQGVAENTGFPDQRFDGISACFVLHEIPPRHANEAIQECHRILKPGGKLVFGEPSAIHFDENNLFKLVKQAGFSALYFRWLARFVYEPFVVAWHKKDIKQWLEDNGFDLIADNDQCPIRTVVAQKR